jgi:putative flippase GtrA
MVRPAYVFAERLENSLKILFVTSIFISTLISALWGFVSLGDLVKLLIQSILGRIIMIIIGFSYFLLGLWKLTHVKK